MPGNSSICGCTIYSHAHVVCVCIYTQQLSYGSSLITAREKEKEREIPRVVAGNDPVAVVTGAVAAALMNVRIHLLHVSTSGRSCKKSPGAVCVIECGHDTSTFWRTYSTTIYR